MERQRRYAQTHSQHHEAADAGQQDRRQPDVLARLEQAIGEIHDSETFRRYLEVQAKFYRYSWRNVALILSQRPESTHVAGYNAWLKLHRYVRQGEHGIKIIVPMTKKQVNAEGEDEQRLFFGTGTVFDLSQTDGEPLPEVAVPILEGEEGGPLMDQLLELAQREHVQVGLDRGELPAEAAGAYWPGDRKIRVRPAPMRQMSKTLAHEMAHHVHLTRIGQESSSREERETVAESSAYVVCQHFGVDSGERSFPYVALWAQDRAVFQEALSSIQRVSATIIDALETGEPLPGTTASG